MTIHDVCVENACTAARLATTEVSPTTEPTERSMPPPMITKVMPMLTTPTIDA